MHYKSFILLFALVSLSTAALDRVIYRHYPFSGRFITTTKNNAAGLQFQGSRSSISLDSRAGSLRSRSVR